MKNSNYKLVGAHIVITVHLCVKFRISAMSGSYLSSANERTFTFIYIFVQNFIFIILTVRANAHIIFGEHSTLRDSYCFHYPVHK